MLIIGQNWGKIANYPPMLNEDWHPCLDHKSIETKRKLTSSPFLNENMPLFCVTVSGKNNAAATLKRCDWCHTKLPNTIKRYYYRIGRMMSATYT